MSVEIIEDLFGDVNNEPVRRFTMKNSLGMEVQVISYGGAITSLKLPDKNGVIDDIVLGFDDIYGYLGLTQENPYFGASIGRLANRVGKGQFSLNGERIQLSLNDGQNHLHGGFFGFDKRLWSSYVEGSRLTLSYVSQDGEEGYPGTVLANITFELMATSNELHINYQATTSKPTAVGLTNHTYFNLSGHQNADQELRGHFIEINADDYTPVDDGLITTGEILPVAETAFDFRSSKNLYELLLEFQGPNGYDHNFCIRENPEDTLRLSARVEQISNGRVMEVYSNQPGVQFYSGNFLPDLESNDPVNGKSGAKYWRHGALALETQNYPNAVNHANFPSPILNPGGIYQHQQVYKFSVLDS